MCLELDAHGELELPGSSARRLTGNEHRALVYVDRGRISAWVAGVDVIERVVSVQAELYKQPLMEREIFLRRQVRVEEVGAKFGVPASGADLIETRGGEITLWPVGVKIVEPLEEGSVMASCTERADIC